MKNTVIYIICYLIILTLVNIAVDKVDNTKMSKALLAFAIEITFIYAAFYGGTMG